YLADILTIADEDRAQHGDIKPGNIRIDESGAVSLEGWGAERRTGRAPEGAGAASADVYGVGVVLHACLSDTGLGALPRKREDHDTVIAERIAEIDWQDLNDKRWMDEVLHFICGMLAFDPGARPVPLDVANILGQVSAQAGGEGLADWAGRVVEPLSRDEPKRPAPLAVEEEDLGGPEVLDAPVSQGQAFSMRKAASAKGESTAFWTRDRIREMLAEEDDEDEPVRQRFTPRDARSPAPTASTVPRLPQPGSGPPLVPPFPDATVEGQPARAPREPRPPPNLHGSVHDVPEPPKNVRPPAPPAPAPAVPSPPPRQHPRPERSPSAGAPVAHVGSGGQLSRSEARSAVDDARRLKIAIVVGALMVFLCGGGAAGTAAVMYTLKQQSESEAALVRPAVVPAQRPALKKAADTAGPDDKPEADAPPVAEEKTPARKSTRRTPRARPGQATKKAATKKAATKKAATKKAAAKKKATRQASIAASGPGGPAGAPASAPTAPSGVTAAPAATPGGFPATVKWVHQGIETTLECSPGGRKVFVGTLRMEIEDVTTCRVKTDSSMTAVQLRRGGTVTCTESGGRLACSGPR
ncbi:MAG: hypothetical protein VX000_15100, partial [Myxococcota bacterium]|nr:hypothetical protein [Myxococcota bacterium]